MREMASDTIEQPLCGRCSAFILRELEKQYPWVGLAFAVAQLKHRYRQDASNKTKEGLEKARLRGIRLGRPSFPRNTDKVLELKKLGFTYREIGKETGYSNGVLTRIFKTIK